ncbi:MAG: hypothetical protein AAFR71_14130 [Pseudomonadota bacterium]
MEKQATLKALAAALALNGSAVSAAQAVDMPFTATVTSTCTMVVIRDGQLTMTNGDTVLRSNTGGGNARVNVFTNVSGFELSVDGPTVFDQEPATDVGSPETFQTEVRGRRDTVFGWTTGPATLNQGETRARVRMIIRKTGSDTFAAGDYRAIATLRCE